MEAAPPTPTRLREQIRPVVACLIVAAIIRVGVACWPVIHHPDELWQYLEPANHVASGPWVMTWEARDGIRSGFLPMLLGGPLALGQAIAPGTFLGILFARLVCVAISLGAVLGAMSLGFRLSRAHGIVAGLVVTTWYEIAYFAPRTMSEALATSLIVAAAALLAERDDRRRMAVGGLVLAFAALTRFQYAPATFVLAAATGRGDIRRWAILAGGALVATIVVGACDMAFGQPPLVWILHNFSQNIVANRSAAFGVGPWYDYFDTLADLWGWVLVPMAVVVAFGMRRYPVLFAVALVNFAVHSAVPHKEYRFILLTTALLVLLGAIGSVDLWRRFVGDRVRIPVLVGGWIVAAGICGATGLSASEWGQSARTIETWRIAARQPKVCGVGIYRPLDAIIASYALFGGKAPIYQYDTDDRPDAALASRAFNMLLTPGPYIRRFPGYQLRGCGSLDRPELCVLVRPGPCTPTAADMHYGVNAVLKRNNI